MVHRRNSSDAAIGWISTVDSLLLGFGLMLVLALHSAMTRGDQQAVVDQTAKQLEAETGARERSEKENQEWQRKIDGLEMQSSRLREQLAAGIQGAEGINQKLGEALQERDALKKQKAADEDKVATALAELEDARNQRDEAKKLVTSDGKERDSLRAQVDEMAERLESQLGVKNQEVASLRNELEKTAQSLSTLKAKQSEADRLLKQALGDVTKYRTQAGEANRRLIAKEQENAALARSQKALDMSNGDLNKKQAEAESAIQRGKQLQGQLDAKSKDLDRVERKLREAEIAVKNAESQRLKEANARGQTAATDVLGFKGRFSDVVFIVDTSRSMTWVKDPLRQDYVNAKYRPVRWNNTKNEIVSWATHLPMKTLRLVLFHTEVWDYPDDGGVYQMDGGVREESVSLIKTLLDQVDPDGNTNTLDAFMKAYSYPNVDTIVLFTDGHPEVPGQDSGVLRNKVLALVKKNRHIPVNVVGIGEYFDRSFADFLRGIAAETGGEFIGR
jgi:septal ring factor EnvC (AmiA/AmiB activator)